MSSSRHRRSRPAIVCVSAAVAATLAWPVCADPAPSYPDLVARLGQSPGLVEAEALADAAEARFRQADVRPNPVLSIDVENAFGSGPYARFGGSETTLTLSQDLELWGRRGARSGVARADADAAVLRRDLAVVDGAGRLAVAYAEAEAAQRRAELAEENLSLTIADARAALLLVEEGREPVVRGIQAESEAAAARAALDEALAERDAAFAYLTAVAMLSAPVTEITFSLLDLTPAPAESARTVSPTVRVAEADRGVAERRILAERALSRPDITASVGFRRYEMEDATAFTFGLSMPLPLFDRNRGNIDAAQAEYRAADARVAGARQQAQADRAAAVSRLNASISRVRAADAGVAAAEEAYRLSRIGFEAGRISQLELRATRTALVNARAAAVEARLARVRAEVDLARQDGRMPFQGAL